MIAQLAVADSLIAQASRKTLQSAFGIPDLDVTGRKVWKSERGIHIIQKVRYAYCAKCEDTAPNQTNTKANHVLSKCSGLKLAFARSLQVNLIDSAYCSVYTVQIMVPGGVNDIDRYKRKETTCVNVPVKVDSDISLPAGPEDCKDMRLDTRANTTVSSWSKDQSCY